MDLPVKIQRKEMKTQASEIAGIRRSEQKDKNGGLSEFSESSNHVEKFHSISSCLGSQAAIHKSENKFGLHKSENKLGLHKSENKFAFHKSENEFALHKSENEFNPNPQPLPPNPEAKS